MCRILWLPFIVAGGLLAVTVNTRSDADQGDDGSWTVDFPVEKDDLQTTGHNPYFILEPGYCLVLEGGKEQVTITVLSETKTVAGDRKSTRLNSSHIQKSRMPSSA